MSDRFTLRKRAIADVDDTERRAIRRKLVKHGLAHPDDFHSDILDDRLTALCSENNARLRNAALKRIPSSSSIHSISLASELDRTPPPPWSAKTNLRTRKLTYNYFPNADCEIPLCASDTSIFFKRKDAIYYLSPATPTDVKRFCKTKEHEPIFIEHARLTDHLVVGTSQRHVLLYDVASQQSILDINGRSSSAVSALKINGPLVTIGGDKGVIKLYDSRIGAKAHGAVATFTQKMKKRQLKLSRHESKITALAWNRQYTGDGRLLASGDDAGNVLCWDIRSNDMETPSEIGDIVKSRRRKLQHRGAITALEWMPQFPDSFASGDITGEIQLWDTSISKPKSNAIASSNLESKGKVVGIHFSPYMKEFATVIGTLHESHIPKPLPPLSYEEEYEQEFLQLSQPEASASTGPAHSRPPSRFSRPMPPPPPPSNFISVHAYPNSDLVNKIDVPFSVPKGASGSKAGVDGSPTPVVSASVLCNNGRQLAVAIPSENKIKICDVWGEWKEPKPDRRESKLDPASYIR